MKTDSPHHRVPGQWHAEFDHNGKCIRTMYADSYLELLGLSNETEYTFSLTTWSNRIHPDDKKRVEDALTEALAKHPEGMDIDIEYRMMTRYGYRWFHDYGHIIRRADGSVISCEGVVFDIQDSLEEHKRLFFNENFHQNNELLSGLASKYTALYCLDLDTGLYQNYLATPKIQDVKEKFSVLKSSIDLFNYFVDSFVHPDFQEAMHHFYPSDKHLRDMLRWKKQLRIHFKRKYQENYLWTELEVLKYEDEMAEAHTAIAGFSECEDLYQQELVLKNSVAKDQILSDITQSLYGFNLTVDLEHGKFKLITGTGAEDAIAHMQKPTYREVYEEMMARIRPEYHDKLRELVSLDFLWMNRNKKGYYKTEEYQTIGDDETSLWEEVNVTFGNDEEGHPIANILGRDITQIRREKALQEQKIRAAQAKNEVLSGITQTLYGFNVTANLVANTYSLITGTGTQPICDMLSNFEDTPYTVAIDKLLASIPQDYKDEAVMAIGRDVLLGLRHKRGYLGTRKFPWYESKDKAYWCEINTFMGENEKGEPIANLLGRDITQQYEQQERQEREREAANAKDRILSEITQALYGYNLTVNLKTLKYTVITGTGMDIACDIFTKNDDFNEAVTIMLSFVAQHDRDKIAHFLNPVILNRIASEGTNGAIGTETYEATINHAPQWHEANVFIGTDANGDPIANILGRNVTEQHNEREQREREARAAAAKDQILSGITRSLYGYNITVNLKTLECSVIRGTGTEWIAEMMEHIHDYKTLTDDFLKHISPIHQKDALKLLSAERMRLLSQQGASGFAGNVEYEINCPNKSMQWHEVNLFIGANENGDPIANILGRNVTEKHNEQERREREARAAAAKDQILSGITQALYGYNITVNLDTLFCSVIRGNGMDCIVNAIESTHNYSTILQEYEHRIPQNQLPIARKLLSYEAMHEMAKQGKSGFIGSSVFETFCAIHGRHWHEINLFLSTDENNHSLANILARDVTEQHERQEQREREREASVAKDRILSEITQALYGYNLTVNLKTLSYTIITGTGMEKACNIFKKYDNYEDALRVKLQWVLPHDKEKISQLLDPAILQKKASEGINGAVGVETYEADIDGEHQWHEANIFIGTDANGDPIANILGRDITEQRKQAEATTQLLAAQEANKAKTAFLFNMSHDIRTPMNAIRGFTDIAKKSLENHDRLIDCLNKIDNSSELLLSLINSVLDMSRVESGKVRPEESPSDVKDSFNSIQTTMQVLATTKGIALSFTIGKLDNPYVYADKDRCNRIFVNIISNAIKYSKPHGYVKVSCEQIKAVKDGIAWYRYIFEDNGIGMSKDFCNHLFEEFTRERNSTTSGIQGTGLGLSLCKSFVELLGGTISCQSKQGVGTTFTVDLPFHVHNLDDDNLPSETQEETALAAPDNETTDAYTGKRILLVEDNELNREVAEFQLEDHGFIVESVEDGSLAVQIVKEKGLDYYDFILMDIQMPIMGGYEATKLIREYGYTRPIIALSANAFDEDKTASLAAGMNAHVAKPINTQNLLEALGAK